MTNTKTTPCLPAAPRRGKSSIFHSAYSTMRHCALSIVHCAFLIVAMAAMTTGTAFAAPKITTIYTDVGSREYGVGDTIEIKVEFNSDDDNVAYTGGTPSIVLSNIQPGGSAEALAVGTDESYMIFNYTVKPGDFSAGIGVSEFKNNGATIEVDGESLTSYTLPANAILAGETITIETITFVESESRAWSATGSKGGTLTVAIDLGGNAPVAQTFDISASQSGKVTFPASFTIPTGTAGGGCTLNLTGATTEGPVTVTFHPRAYDDGFTAGDLKLTLSISEAGKPSVVAVYYEGLGNGGSFAAGDEILLSVEVTNNIPNAEMSLEVTGTPLLSLAIAPKDKTHFATFIEAEENKLYFSYTVQPGDFTERLDCNYNGLSINNGSIWVVGSDNTRTQLGVSGRKLMPTGTAVGSLYENAQISIKTITLEDEAYSNISGNEGDSVEIIVSRHGEVNEVQNLSLKASQDGNVDYPQTISIPRNERTVTFTLNLVEKTTQPITLTIHPNGYPAGENNAPGAGDIVISISIAEGTKPPIIITGPSQMEEGAVSQELTVYLSRAPRETTTVKISSDFPANLAILSATSLTFAPGDTTTRSVTVKPLDGDKQVTITAEQQGATESYSKGTLQIFVANKNPEIVSPPAENWEPPKGGEGFAYNVSWSAKDVAADQPGLDAIIYWGDGTSTTVSDTPQGSTTHTYNVPGSFGITIEIRDKDGGVATVSGTVEIEPAVTIVINEYKTYPYPGDVGQNSYKGLEGLGRGTVDDNVGETSRIPLTENIDWQIKYSPSTATATLIASPETFTYEGIDYEGNVGDYEYDSFFHVWLGDEETFRSQWCMIPLSAPVTAAIRLRDGGDSADRQVGAVFSREHYSEDNYADIDWDRLPDRWESLYLSALTQNGDIGDDEATYPFETPAGIFGENGNPDKDFLPACVTGIDAVTGEFTIEGCDFSPTGLAFINLYEVRGTHLGLNAKNSDKVEELMDEPHKGSYDDDGIFTDNDTREFYGTDPTKPDTDEDKLSDGYEYFFWRLAKFGDAKGQAYDPTKVIEGNPIDNALIEAYFNPCVPNDHLTLDVDGDGLTDFEEFLLGTNPIHWDTDGDQMNDGWEVMWGLDPKDKGDATDNPDGDFMANDGLNRFHWDVYNHYGFDPRTAWNATYLERNRKLALPAPNTAPFSNYHEHYLARWFIDHNFVNEVGPMSGDFMTQPVPYGTPRFYNPSWNGTKRKVPNYSVTPSGGTAVSADDSADNTATATTTGGYTVPFGDLSYIVEQIPITSHGCDSDGDGMPDGWELYLCTTDGNVLDGLWPNGSNYAPIPDTIIDIDRENLNNLEECRSVELCDYYSSICTNGSFTFRGNWFNKWWPTDPFNPDTDGDHLSDADEGDDTFRYQDAFTSGGTNGAATAEAFVAARFGETTMLRGHVPGGGLNPCCIDTDMDYIPDHWEYLYAGHYRDTAWAGGFCNEPGTETGLTVQNGQAFIALNGAGMDGTYFDSRSGYDEHTGAEDRNFDFDGDGLENYQEYWINGVRHFQYDKWVAGGDYGAYDPQAIFATGRFPQAKDQGYEFRKWLTPLTPETVPISTLFMSWDWSTYANDWQNAGAETPDTDPHVMSCPSMFHYMPSEIRPKPIGPYLYASTDPRLADSDGDGMDDYYEMFHGLNPILSDVLDYCMQEHPAGETYDFRAFPWMAGMPNADPDGDDIPNWEEALSPGQPAPANHNTDPSPLWMTDMSYDHSFVNLYYNWGSAANFWTTENEEYPEYEHYPFPDNMVPGMMDPRAHYVFDFESNEGFDTDNDNLSDPYEINGSAGGVTDSQNPDRPVGRKALYLDGNAAARTRSLCAFGPNALRSFTLEVWVMPEEPASGKMQVILERPVTWDESNTAPTYEQIRRNFRLGLLADGRPFIEFDNGGKNLITERALAPEGSALEAGKWCHLAATMDGFSGKLTLYKDGRRIASKSTTSVPYTGFTTTALNAVGSDEYHQPRWSPVVIGASDANPVGQVDGSWEYYNTVRNPIQGGQPQLGDFFKGWVDEVRIWDGARPGAEDAGDQRVAFWRWPTIKDDYDNLKRYGMDEVLAARNDLIKYLNRIVDWRKRSIDTANAEATAALNGFNPVNPSDTNTVVSTDTTWSLDGRGLTFDEFIQQAVTYILMTGGEDIKCRIPPSLVCVYNFDTLPDPDYEPVQPAKFASLNGRPMDYNGVPWWRGATDRSTVYTSAEAPYLFPQYIQNLVSWQPLGHLVAAGTDEEYSDILGVMGVFSTNVVANMPLFAYQPDSVVNSKYWTRYTKGGQNLADLEAYSTWGTDMVNSFPNSANPYGYRYETGIIVNEENHPITMMQEAYDPSYAALFNDLVPLRNARADMSVQLWDDPKGTGVGVNSDTDGDGLPDWWEIANGMDPHNADQNGDDVRDDKDDFDGDGLSNWYEYLAGTMPYDTTTDGENNDKFADLDGDGLSNQDELKFETHPGRADTDDDGIPDKVEIDSGFSPIDSTDPLVLRFLRNDGEGWVSVPGDIPEKDLDGNSLDRYGMRFDFPEWTIEATVRLTAEPQDEILLLQRKTEPLGSISYELGIGVDRVPFVHFQSDIGADYRVNGYAPVPLNEWTHLAGRFGKGDDGDGDRNLVLFVNGAPVQRDVTDAYCAQGRTLGDVIMAKNLIGDIDEVRLWNCSLPAERIMRAWNKMLLYGADVADMGSLKADGGGTAAMSADVTEARLTEWTVEAWVNTTEAAGEIIRRDTPHNGNYAIEIVDGAPKAIYGVHCPGPPACPGEHQSGIQYGSVEIIGTEKVNDGKWHHVAFVLDGESASLYVDGKQNNAVNYPPSAAAISWGGDSTTHVFGGIDTDNGSINVGRNLYGLIDEVRIYNRALTEAELSRYVYSQVDPNSEGGRGLLVYWTFDDVDLTQPLVTVKNKSSINATGMVNSDAKVVVKNFVRNGESAETSCNAPITFNTLAILGDKLVAYFPFEDGRWPANNGVRAVEDFKHRQIGIGDPDDIFNECYSASLSDVSYIDFVSYNGHTPLDCYDDPMLYPTHLSVCDPTSPFRSFPLPVDCPWITDSDGDGMPDVFEVYYGLDPNNKEPKNVLEWPEGDFDGDGLSNYYEYLAGTDPTFWSSVVGGVGDGDIDTDGDGISNRDEQLRYTNPGRVDTDDDDFDDLEEFRGWKGLDDRVRTNRSSYASSPLWSNDPIERYYLHAEDNKGTRDDTRFNFKSMKLDGVSHEIPRPATDRHRFDNAAWTIEAFVYMTEEASGSLIRYEGEGWTNSVRETVTFYELGLDNGMPYVAFQGSALRLELAVYRDPIPTNKWVHLAGVFDPARRTLELYEDGSLVSAEQTLETPLSASMTTANIPGHAFIGDEGLFGNIDEVRIWSVARTWKQVEFGANHLVQLYEPGLVADFRFDDGGESAEDYAHRLTHTDLETTRLYFLTKEHSDFTAANFDRENAVYRFVQDFDDADGDGLPDAWEDRYMEAYLRHFFHTTPYDLTTPVTWQDYHVMGADSASFTASHLEWKVANTPLYSTIGHRWITNPDVVYLFRDFMLSDDDETAKNTFLELRMAAPAPDNTKLWINGTEIPLSGEGAEDVLIGEDESIFSNRDAGNVGIPGTAVVVVYYLPNTMFTNGVLRAGRNRIALMVVNRTDPDLDEETIGNIEYFNLELRANGNQYLIRKGGDASITDPWENRWWYWGYAASMAVPPVDGAGNEWYMYDYCNDKYGDPDEDGLPNWFEALIDTNPLDVDTDGDGILDRDEDDDHDGLTNMQEFWYSTHPKLSDTDDDGVTDGEEIREGYDPLDSFSPFVARAIRFDGTDATRVVSAASTHYNVSGSFTINAMVKPEANPSGIATIVSHEIEDYTVEGKCFDYYVTLDENRQVHFGFTPAQRREPVEIVSPDPLPLDEWSRITACFDADSLGHELKLFIDGFGVSSNKTEHIPPEYATSYSRPVVIGQGFTGLIRNVSLTVSADGTPEGAPKTLFDFRFDDGTGAGSASSGGAYGTTTWPTWTVEDFADVGGVYARGTWQYRLYERTAGALEGNARFEEVGYNFGKSFGMADTNGNGLPDWWEFASGFDPYSLNHDPWDDSDLDGLSDYAEFFAGLNPHNEDTDGNGIIDFFDVPESLSSTPLTYGWLYTDNDYVLDSYEEDWEDPYASAFRYDEHEDRDLDGWDNWSEGMMGTKLEYNIYDGDNGTIQVIDNDTNHTAVAIQATNEASPGDKSSNFPTPNLRVTVNYYGDRIASLQQTGPTNGGARLIIHAYSRFDMNGWPDAVFAKHFTTDTFPCVIDFTIEDVTYGHLRQGKNWFFAWAEIDGTFINVTYPIGNERDHQVNTHEELSSGDWPTWSPNEPAAVANNQLDGIDIGFDLNEITFNLTDKPASFVRSTWDERFSVEYVDEDVDGYEVLIKGDEYFKYKIEWPRTWIHEWDIVSFNVKRGGKQNFGFGAYGAASEMFADDSSPKFFDVRVRPEAQRRMSPNGTTGFVKAGSFTNWTHTAAALGNPILYGPIGYEIVADARPEFKFSLAPEYTEYQFTLKKGNAEIYNERILAPGRFRNDNDGPYGAQMGRPNLVIWKFPFSIGDRIPHNNGYEEFEFGKEYTWTVVAYAPARQSGAYVHSAAVSGKFLTTTFDTSDPANLYAPGGKGVINVDVSYPSKMVAFSETAFIRIQAYRSKSFNGLPDAAISVDAPGTYRIAGLQDGETYYVRAYIEQGGDPLTRDKWESWGYYRAGVGEENPFVPVGVTATRLGNTSPYPITIQDCDTDNDLLPDSYEWASVGSLTGLGVAEYAPTARKTVALGVSPLVFLADNPLVQVQADYDGDNVNDYAELLDGTNMLEGDTDGDGIADGLERTLGFDATTPQALKITSVAFDADGNPVLDWTWDGAAKPTKGRAMLKMGRKVIYEVQAKVSLTDAEWTTVRTVYTDDIDGQAVITEEGAPDGVDVSAFRFFRVKLGTE